MEEVIGVGHGVKASGHGIEGGRGHNGAVGQEIYGVPKEGDTVDLSASCQHLLDSSWGAFMGLSQSPMGTNEYDGDHEFHVYHRQRIWCISYGVVVLPIYRWGNSSVERHCHSPWVTYLTSGE